MIGHLYENNYQLTAIKAVVRKNLISIMLEKLV